MNGPRGRALGCGAAVALLQILSGPATAGIFPPPAGQNGSLAVAADDVAIKGWATRIIDYTPGAGVDAAAFGDPARALGAAGYSDPAVDPELEPPDFINDAVALGRGGSITLAFDAPISDGPGADFAVFENAFSDTFLELAFVEVSSDGGSFHRLPGMSLTASPVGSFNLMDASRVDNVAGKYRGGFGTPFDLAQLPDTAGLDLDRITHVRLVDIVGDGSAANALTPDNLAAWLGVPVASLPAGLLAAIANPPPAIYDPFPTVLEDGVAAGFDLDAIAVLNAGAPLPAQPVPVPVPVPALVIIGVALAALRIATHPPNPRKGKYR